MVPIVFDMDLFGRERDIQVCYKRPLECEPVRALAFAPPLALLAVASDEIYINS
jgi:hypothetical protein